MVKILKKKEIALNTIMMEVHAPLVALRAMPGQFIILRISEDGERTPLTITDYDKENGTITIVFQTIGFTTKHLGMLNVGEYILDFVGPLGKASELDELDNVIFIGGGVGVAPIYPQVKYLHSLGRKVDVILGARNKDLLILLDEFKAVTENLYITTDDGSMGLKGLVTDQLRQLVESGHKCDHVVAIGPMVMMKFVSLLTKELGIPTTVSLNSIMVDGTGMCGSCRVTVGGIVKYACVEGPDFNGHEVDFNEAITRQSIYNNEETRPQTCKLFRGIEED